MSKTKALLVVAFLLVCAAGAVVGMALDRRVQPQPDGDPFAALHLTDSQHQQLKAIWSGVMERPDEITQKHQQMQQQRNDSIRKLLTPEQQTQYDQIQQEYRRQSDALESQMQQAFHDAEEQSRRILTPAQQITFDEIRKKMGPHRHFHHVRSHPASGPTTAP